MPTFLTTVALSLLGRRGGAHWRWNQRSWLARRRLHLFLLVAPMLLSGAILLILHFCFAATHMCMPAQAHCSNAQVLWQLGARWLALGVALCSMGALVLTSLRVILLRWWLWRTSTPAPVALQAAVADLAARMEVRMPQVRLWRNAGAVAVTCGIIRPTLVVAPWLTTDLDAQEQEAVLAHEVAHIARNDYRLAWLALCLRDAWWFVPSSRRAYQQLRRDQEWACDERAVAVTQRPLALASALGKVWHRAVAPPAGLPVLGLTSTGEALHARILRLLQHDPVPPAASAALQQAAKAYTALLVTVLGCGMLALIGTVLLFLL